MTELIEKVMAKTGLSMEQAKPAVETVLNFLKDKLPGPIAAQIENVVGKKDGDGSSGGGLGDMAKGLLG